MPTSHKREAVQLRPDVHAVILQLSGETSLSKSKVISILVEEALKARGMYDGPALTPAMKAMDPETVALVQKEAEEVLPYNIKTITRNTRTSPDELSWTQRMNQNIAENKLRKEAGLPKPTESAPKESPPSNNDQEMMRQFAEFQQFKKMMQNS